MSQEANSGYKGTALSALSKAECQVGDIIRVTSKEKTYEGILIPRSETGNDKHIVIKPSTKKRLKIWMALINQNRFARSTI